MIAVKASAQGSGPVGATVPVAACRAASSAGSRGTIDNASGAMIAVNTAQAVSTNRNTTIDRRATRPEAAASLAVLTPTMTSASTSGTTVICSALSQSLPTGCATSAMRTASAGSDHARTSPIRAPRPSPVRTREVALIRYGSNVGNCWVGN
jgi:hypothetical protein